MCGGKSALKELSIKKNFLKIERNMNLYKITVGRPDGCSLATPST